MVVVSLTPEQIAFRFDQAYRYKRLVVDMPSLSPAAWRALYRDLIANPAPDLPMGLALIAPSVAPLSEQRWADLRGNRFGDVPRGAMDQCGSRRVWGYECPGAEDRLQLDHAWPYALGGRSVAENGVWLCGPHNHAKSWDVHCYTWERPQRPRWLDGFLARIDADLASGRYDR